MAYKQEPCPLCGRNMTAIETYPGRGELYCGHCDLTIGGNDAKTPEELIALMDSSEHRRLKAENRKLRELVRDMWRFTGAACKKYPRLFDPPAQGPQVVQFNAIEAYEQRMHELGIEVDG